MFLVLVVVLVLPTISRALTVDDVQTQIKELLQKVATLQEQLKLLQKQEQASTTVKEIITDRLSIYCPRFDRTLSLGNRGNDVRELQELLVAQGLLPSDSATGFFGPLTKDAVQRIQIKEGVISGDFLAGQGVVGPRTHNVFKRFCIPRPPDSPCTKEYAPVCASKPIVCITTPCDPIQQTYSNKCMARADGATPLYEGKCRADAPKCTQRPACLDSEPRCLLAEPLGGWCPDPSKDLRCKTWYGGCNSCSRETPTSPAICTLRACAPESMTRPYCTAWFDDAGNKPPVISSFSGPTVLAVNETGTWTVKASDPENQSLTYSVSWGDEYGFAVPNAASPFLDRVFQQTTTFTHTYAKAGTYTVVAIVRDSVGKEAKTITTVKVGTETTTCAGPKPTTSCDGTWVLGYKTDTYYGDGCIQKWTCQQAVACTMEYAPVCGLPAYCSNLPPNAAQCSTTANAQTFSNRCAMNASNATFLYEGQCATNSGTSGN